MKVDQQAPVRQQCTDTADPEAVPLACNDCGAMKAPEEFRRRFAGRDARVRQCRGCHAEAERLRRRAKRSRQHRQEVNRDLARLKKAKSARQVALVCDSMIRAFGGVEGFRKSWTGCLRADLERGGFAALRHLEATVRLIQHCERDQGEKYGVPCRPSAL